jgi:hypothetical protein
VVVVAPTPSAAGQDPSTTVVSGTEPAQQIGPPQVGPSTVPVVEIHQKADKVILDTSDPLAVQPGKRDPFPQPDPRTPEQKIADELAGG